MSGYEYEAVFSNNLGTQATSTATLMVNPLPVILAGNQVYDGAATTVATYLSVANEVSGDSLVLSGNVAIANASVGVEPITSFVNLTLSGPSANNYTLTGAYGSVTIAKGARTARDIFAESPRGSKFKRSAAHRLMPAEIVDVLEDAAAEGLAGEAIVLPDSRLPLEILAFTFGTPGSRPFSRNVRLMC